MRRCLFVAFVISAFAILADPVAGARPGPVQASVSPEATLVEGGAAVLVDVTVRCAGGSDVLEAFVYVTQDGQQSQFVPIPVRLRWPGADLHGAGAGA
jgi:hypothetical protein